MLGILRNNHNLALIFDKLRDRIFGRLRAAEPAIEQIALLGFLRRGARRTHDYSRHRFSENNSIECRARETNPGAAVRSWARGT